MWNLETFNYVNHFFSSDVVTLWCTELPSVVWIDFCSPIRDWDLSDTSDIYITWVCWGCRPWVRMCLMDWYWVSV